MSIRAGVIATVFWGVAGFLVGVVIALQLAYPELNIEPWYQLRPAAAAAHLGGDLRLRRQRADRHSASTSCSAPAGARLFGGNLAWFVFWGYQLFIVMAATGYLLGITQSREYAEPEWYVDLWLTIVWVAYLVVFLGTILKRKEPHIYVANWFYLVLHRHHRDAARGQQPGDAGLARSARRATRSSPACRMR